MRELKRLQELILEEFPHLLPLCSEPEEVTPHSREICDEGPAVGPAAWSILHRTLPDLFELSPIPIPHQLEGEARFGTLRLPATDLERLRSIAVFPEDTIHLLYSLTTGYLIQAGLSDTAISIMIAALARNLGHAGAALQSLPTPNAPHLSLYAELPADLLDLLVVPGFRFPALLGIADGDGSTVPWNAVAKITERTVICRLGFSVTALRAIQYLWQLQGRAVSIAGSARAGLPTRAYGDFVQLAEGYLQLAVARKCGNSADQKSSGKYWHVLRARLSLVDGRKWSLSKLGRQCGVSGERVRQVESRVLADLKSPETLQHLDYLWHLLEHLLTTGGGVHYAGELSVSLRDIHGWSHPPSEEALVSIIELSPAYQIVRDAPMRVALAGSSCAHCATGGRAVLMAVEAAPDLVLSFDEALEVMLEVCQRERCPELRKVERFSKGLVHHLADSTADIVVRGEKLRFRDAQHRKSTNRQHVLEQIVLAAADGIHFKEVQRQFNRVVPEAAASENRTHGWLFEIPSVMLWGHGNFKHRDLIRIPTSLIMEIQRDLSARLDTDGIPYLCLNGSIYEHYRDRLSQEGVPNSIALYSCLRMVDSASLAFNEYPYALRKDDPKPRPPISALLEDFVSTHKGPVTTEQIKAFATKLGTPANQLSAHRSRMRNVKRIGKGIWLHCSNAPMVADRLGMIVRASSELEPGGSITQDRLYRENHAACQALGITKPGQLTSLIRQNFPGTIDITRRGAVSARGKTTSKPKHRRAGKLSLPKQLHSYLEEQAKPCKTKELLDLFRDSAGATDGRCLAALRMKEKVLWYTKYSVIARRALEWSLEKQAAIEALATRHLEQRAKCGKPYGLCSEIHRKMGRRLPKIPPHLSWTPVLLQSLLGSGGKFVALGRQRDVIISKENPHQIATLDDLILYTLQTDYGGTAALTAFTSGLRRSGLMSKKVSTFLQGKDPRVIIEGGLIRAADPDAPGLPSLRHRASPASLR